MASLKRRKVANGKANDRALLFHAMYIMAAVDGSVSSEEATVLRGVVASLPDFRDADVDSLLRDSTALTKRFGGVLESIEGLMELSAGDIRYRAFVLAVEVAYASGSVNAAEDQLLSSMSRVLGLDAGVCEGIANVISFKYVD
jgi:tellurite resistance protein